MNTFIFIGLIVIIVGIILRFTNEIPILDVNLIIIGTIFLFFGLFIIDTPTAMDVYQGKTTLEITYKDGIPVDSVVVFKNKEK
jgi:hypothetical protein